MDQTELLKLASDLYKQYGYYILFAACLLENVVFVGLFIPGEVFILLAAFLAAEGYLKVGHVFVLAFLGSVIGNSLGYYIGLKTGRAFLEELGRRFTFLAKRLHEAEEYFDQYGPRTIFLGRFASGVKAFVTALAGSAKMNYSKFFLYSTASALIWSAAMTVLGYFFGSNWRLILKIVNRIGLGVLVALILLIVVPFLVARRRREK